MLYMIGMTPTHFWTAENFLICACECLKEIVKYVETGYCPNYFITVENMFEGQLTGINRIKLRFEMLTDCRFKVIAESENCRARRSLQRVRPLWS